MTSDPPANEVSPVGRVPRFPSFALWCGIGCGLLAFFVVLLVGFVILLRNQESQLDVARHEKLTRILAEYCELRGRETTDAEWEAFCAQAYATGQTLSQELEPAARRSNPHKQYMLWCAKHRLLEMLQQRRESVASAEAEYEQNLYEAAKIMKIPMEKKPLSQPPG